jgi:hypothetical protein
VRPVTAPGAPLADFLPPENERGSGRPAMCTQIHRFWLILAISSLLGACTMGHRIEGPGEPIRIEMTVLLQHEYILKGDGAGS